MPTAGDSQAVETASTATDRRSRSDRPSEVRHRVDVGAQTQAGSVLPVRPAAASRRLRRLGAHQVGCSAKNMAGRVGSLSLVRIDAAAPPFAAPGRPAQWPRTRSISTPTERQERTAPGFSTRTRTRSTPGSPSPIRAMSAASASTVNRRDDSA